MRDDVALRPIVAGRDADANARGEERGAFGAPIAVAAIS